MTDYEPEGLQARIVATLDVDADTIKRVRWGNWRFRVTKPFHIRVTNAAWGVEADEHTYEVAIAKKPGPDVFAPVTCSCPAYTYHDGDCKHQLAVAAVGGPPIIGGAVVADQRDVADDENGNDPAGESDAPRADGGRPPGFKTLAEKLA